MLYDRVLGEDDRFILSKGHGPAAYYAVLAAKGMLPVELLDGFGNFDSPLGHHPDRIARARSRDLERLARPRARRSRSVPRSTGRRIFCLVGDGELDEGSNWEAVQYAGRVGLGVADGDRRSTTTRSTHGWPGGIERRFMLEGWTALRVDGRDHDALEAALTPDPERERPRCVVAEVETR